MKKYLLHHRLNVSKSDKKVTIGINSNLLIE